MNEFNQLRQNVRNYAVGLTCEEIEKEIKRMQDRLFKGMDTVNANFERERIQYIQEYLDELKAEQSK